VAAPVVYVSTWRIKAGAHDAYERFYAELVRIVRDNEPRVSAFLAFENEDRTELTNVHVYPDAAALDDHMAVLAAQMQLLPDDLTAVTANLEPVRILVFGAPSGAAARMDDNLRAGGVPFDTKARYLGGFTR
jgi:quinol monooxygenase YgiN